MQHNIVQAVTPKLPPIKIERISNDMAKRSYRKHGLAQAKTALQRYGARAIDGRTKAGRDLAQWTQQLVDDLGGPDQITEMQRTVIELAARTRYLLNGIDAWMIDQPSLINKSKRKLFDVVKERQRLSDALAGYMVQLGLERRQPKGIDLSAYIEQVYGNADRDPGDDGDMADTTGSQPKSAPPDPTVTTVTAVTKPHET